jgi:hypothetical protein
MCMKLTGRVSALSQLTSLNETIKVFHYLNVADLEVIECKPMLKSLDDLVQKLNESREFFEFLKWMRQAFKQNALK